ncbi:hypothetical protein G6O67_003768 [Ophiocordyceps sinensis]|uniref:CCHC-type domain-containing protein n=1 Tax=Ophiocordyceps sinensis TaxID=72228 RepID=A0A8H4PSH6_9HYPO|nr:hypothetical protein G6O67_003768 [Ophiocordyceps sinensis]
MAPRKDLRLMVIRAAAQRPRGRAAPVFQVWRDGTLSPHLRPAAAPPGATSPLPTGPMPASTLPTSTLPTSDEPHADQPCDAEQNTPAATTSTKQAQCQSCGRSRPSFRQRSGSARIRRRGGGRPRCFRCGETGHLARSYARPRRRPAAAPEPAASQVQRCGATGHLARACDQPAAAEPAALEPAALEPAPEEPAVDEPAPEEPAAADQPCDAEQNTPAATRRHSHAPSTPRPQQTSRLQTTRHTQTQPEQNSTCRQ